MSISRRAALATMAGTGAAVLGKALPAEAREPKQVPEQALGMLYDTTRCIGCKACVFACREANDLEPTLDAEGLHHAPLDLDSRTKNVIKLYSDGARRSYVKAQCMQCVDPACASACMLGSLKKDPVTGIVSYDPDYCVGCRYCVMACPFNVAKFEFDEALPNIVKCELCRHRFPKDGETTDVDGFSRFPKGQGPACCEVCPREAVIYGKRSELLAEARRRMEENPDAYVPKIYGEHDGGGTQVLYLSHVPFEDIGLPDLGEQGVPQTAYAVQEGLYKGFAAPVALYAALAGVLWRNRGKEEVAGEGAS